VARFYYRVKEIKEYDSKYHEAESFIGRICEFMGHNGTNPDGSHYGDIGFPDVMRIVTFEGIVLEFASSNDEEDIL